MLSRQKLNVECRVLEKESKIRKRGCSSSSSSSSLVRHYRLKRAVLVKKKGGSITPIPTWKMSKTPLLRREVKQNEFSARKPGATVWEISDAASPPRDEAWENRSKKGVENFAERNQRAKAANHRRRIPTHSQFEGYVSNQNGDIAEIPTRSQIRTPSLHTRLQDLCNGLAAGKELLKVLSRIRIQEEQRSMIMSLVSVLKFELSQARLHANHLLREHQSGHFDSSSLLKFFSEEKAVWKSKEQDRIRNTVTSIGEELKVEKKLRKQAERLNKKLGNELADTKSSLSKALNKLESEKRAREILEQVCDELARGIGEDKDEVEEMKRELAKAREEVDMEREMLQIADVLREERVQMKLSEAKYEFEEKNAAVERMKSELEAYPETQMGMEKSENSPRFSKIKELEEYLWKTLGASPQTGGRGDAVGDFVDREESEEDNSPDSDLHFIELNMDNNSKSYNWGYACDGLTPNDSKRNSVDGKIKRRRSNSEKTQRSIICLERRKSDGSERDVAIHNPDGIDRGRLLELISQNLCKGYHDEIEKFEMVKDLRDHILSGERI